jgi:predicted outer membrane protein
MSVTTPALAVSDVDRAFTAEAAQDNLASIEASKAILGKTSNGFVRNVAQTILADHERGHRELEKIAGTAGIPLPSVLDAAHQRALEQLEAKSGTDLNEAYLHEVGVQIQQQEMRAAEREVQAGKDAALVTFARERLGALPAQVAEAQRLADTQRAK